MNATDCATALDDLQSHLSPYQFAYLMKVLTSSDHDYRSQNEGSGGQSSTPSNSHCSQSPPLSSQILSEDSGSSVSSKISLDSTNIDFDFDHHDQNIIIAPQTKVFGEKTFSSRRKYPYSLKLKGVSSLDTTGTGSQLDDAGLPMLQKHGERSAGLLFPPVLAKGLKGVNFQQSFDTTTSNRTQSSSRRPEGSMLALRSTSCHDEGDDYGVQKNLEYALEKYGRSSSEKSVHDYLAMMRLESATEDQTEIFKSAELCSHLPICKRTVKKFMLGNGQLSRSSSTETVKAESLPEEDNPYEPIAGRIANEPVNPFPILKQDVNYPRRGKLATGKSSKTWSTLLNSRKIEQKINKVLQQAEDYKDVSKYFSQRKKGINEGKKASSKKGVCNLTKRVTNPLYKVYDPSGYTKTEDELGLECINKICDDFNKWLTSLDDNCDAGGTLKKQTSSPKDDETMNIPQVSSEFLVKILRKDLELPE